MVNRFTYLIFIFILSYNSSIGQELITDGGCEDNEAIGTTHQPDGWTEVTANTDCYNNGAFGGAGTANSGVAFFGPNDSNTDHVIQQVINLGADNTGNTFDYSYAYMNAFGGTSHDIQILYEFLSAANADLGDLHDSGTISVSSTTYQTDSGTSIAAPVGTTQIRVTLTFFNTGGFHDAIVDDISLMSNAVLPVELTHFDAKVENQAVKLKWETASEKNNKMFEVQRSTDSKRFETIYTIGGQGDSEFPSFYSFEDREIVSNETYYYRLRQIDFDGRFDFSNVKSIETNDVLNTGIGSIFPNPSTFDSKVQFRSAIAENVQFSIIDNLGKLIISKEIFVQEGLNTMNYDFSTLNKGVYTITFSNNGIINHQQLIVH